MDLDTLSSMFVWQLFRIDDFHWCWIQINIENCTALEETYPSIPSDNTLVFLRTQLSDLIFWWGGGSGERDQVREGKADQPCNLRSPPLDLLKRSPPFEIRVSIGAKLFQNNSHCRRKLQILVVGGVRGLRGWDISSQKQHIYPLH